ncbi:unnamed protein product [Peronospora farinosa]|uniref:Ankyrin repeat-containing domain n=1 Tax=Peronospora farinosa TaxID=134698 RepID=A0ABN8BSL6_9STRA|nr:unnamed protein product [Peronospora farinosa]
MVDDAAMDSQDAVAHAAGNGRLDLVQWYCNMKGPYAFGWNVMDDALAQNQMKVVQFLDCVLGNRCTRRGLEKAALHGHLKVVQWLNNSRYYEIKTFRTLENAIAGGLLHCQILQWLHDRASVKAAVLASWTPLPCECLLKARNSSSWS